MYIHIPEHTQRNILTDILCTLISTRFYIELQKRGNYKNDVAFYCQYTDLKKNKINIYL